MLCPDCNNALGLVVDDKLSRDYWVQWNNGEVPADPNKHGRFVVNAGKLMEPYTDPDSWRAVAKIGFEVLAYIIRDHIFHPGLDEWRSYVHSGSPNLADKALLRVSHFPDQWQDAHVFVFSSAGIENTSLHIRLFNSYEFMCLFKWPYPPKDPNMRVLLDLTTRRMHVWTSEGPGKPWQPKGSRPT